MDKIVGVALADNDNNIIICLPKPFRHFHLNIALYAANDHLPDHKKINDYSYVHKLQQGFITDSGKFLNRTDARILGLQNGQFNHYDGQNNPQGYDNRHFKWAFSEDFWLD